MAQAIPTYGVATGKVEKPIIDTLVAKYGINSVTWPIVLSQNGNTIAYIYERNIRNKLNSQGDNRPTSISGINDYFLEYDANPRIATPQVTFLNDFLLPQYNNSYDFIQNQNQGYSTVDLDYVWQAGEIYKGFELTTFYMQFNSEAEARRVVSMINRRPSWQGANGAHALYKIASAIADLNVNYYFVCANTIGKVGSALNTKGNVLYFPLTNAAITDLSQGRCPVNAVFCSFQEFLDQL